MKDIFPAFETIFPYFELFFILTSGIGVKVVISCVTVGMEQVVMLSQENVSVLRDGVGCSVMKVIIVLPEYLR